MTNRGTLLRKRIREKYGSIRIRWKIYLTYVVLILVTMPIMTAISMRYLEDAAREQYRTMIDHSLEYLRNDVANRLEIQKSIADVLVWQSNLRTILGKSGAGYGFEEQMQDMKELERLTQTYISDVEIKVIAQNAAIYTRERSSIYAVDDIPCQDLQQKMQSAKKSSIRGLCDWNGKEYLTYLIEVSSEADIFKKVGYVAVITDISCYEKLLAGAKPTENTRLFLINESNEIMSTDGDAATESIEEYLVNGEIPDDREFAIYRKLYLEEAGWSIVSLIPQSDIAVSPWSVMANYMIWVGALLFAALVLSAGLSKSITRRMTHLAELVGKYSIDQKTEYIPQSEFSDEIGALQNACGDMILRNEELLRKVYLADIEKRKAEMQALQAQIKPHFLYNTLNAIQWLSLEEKAPQTARAIRMLSSYFRICLQENENIIPLKKEVEHAKAYLDILKIRMEDALQYEFYVPDELEDNMAIRCFLQPLVENSVVHGINMSPKQQGRIVVSAVQEKQYVLVIIDDDGVGFVQNPLTCGKENSGHGVLNTHHRIRMTFGEEYGLEYMNVDTGGTRVIVRLPRQTME